MLGLLTARPPDRVTAQSVPLTIDTIIVVNRNVFDLQEADAPGFIARLANRLHARTRAGVIRATLLVDSTAAWRSASLPPTVGARSLSSATRLRAETSPGWSVL